MFLGCIKHNLYFSIFLPYLSMPHNAFFGTFDVVICSGLSGYVFGTALIISNIYFTLLVHCSSCFRLFAPFFAAFFFKLSFYWEAFLRSWPRGQIAWRLRSCRRTKREGLTPLITSAEYNRLRRKDINPRVHH